MSRKTKMQTRRRQIDAARRGRALEWRAGGTTGGMSYVEAIGTGWAVHIDRVDAEHLFGGALGWTIVHLPTRQRITTLPTHPHAMLLATALAVHHPLPTAELAEVQALVATLDALVMHIARTPPEVMHQVVAAMAAGRTPVIDPANYAEAMAS